SLRQHGRGGRAVAGRVGSLGGRFLDELGTHVFIGIGELDLLGHGHAVLRNRRGSPPLVDHGIPPARAQRALDGPRQLAHAAGQLLTGLIFIGQNLRHVVSPSPLSNVSAEIKPPGTTWESCHLTAPQRVVAPLKCNSCTIAMKLLKTLRAKDLHSWIQESRSSRPAVLADHAAFCHLRTGRFTMVRRHNSRLRPAPPPPPTPRRKRGGGPPRGAR